MNNLLHTLSVGIFIPKLNSLSHVLSKGMQHAETRQLDSGALAAAQLATDMFPLLRQVQLSCDHAKDTAGRLSGNEAPKADNQEKTLHELRGRVIATVEYLRGLPLDSFGTAESQEIQRPLLNNRVLQMQALDFLTKWALPQFYFHVVTAYDILRHNEVEIGKWDYLGDLSASIHTRNVT